ncbi:MAG: hypothetical protein ACLQUY_03520 [Ktedonobacterales bacterium]
MPALLIASASGWSLVVMTAVTISIPFLLRRQMQGVPLRVKFQQGRTFLKRMWPHYWLGYAIAAVTLVHTVVALGSGAAKSVDLLGLFLASAALFLVFFQVLLGLNLRKPGIPSRRALRRMHLGLMIAIVVLGLGHILLDSPTLHSLIRL